MSHAGQINALISAALFGLSPPLAKAVPGDMSPVLLAGLLYLGSALGLQGSLVFQKQGSLSLLKRLGTQTKLRLAGAILCGGILEPLCLAFGIKLGSAFEVSLLLNFETVATTLIAFLIFCEHVGRRALLGQALLLGAAALATIQGSDGAVISKAGILIVAACSLWGVDNNLTRSVEDLPPTLLACIKGWIAGLFNTMLALGLGLSAVTGKQVVACLPLGALSFGVSLVLFVKAMREIGSARAGAYFSVGPFFGMAAAVALLGESVSFRQWLSSGVLALGFWVLHRERHEHHHFHEEGFNNKAKLVKRRGYGYKSFENYRLKVLTACA